MKKLTSLLIALALLAPWLSPTLLAQQALELRSALRYAADHHATVQKANLEIAKGKQLIRESLSTGLPQVSANADFAYNPVIQSSFLPAQIFDANATGFIKVPFGQRWNGNAGITLDQKVFDKTWLVALEGTRKLNELNQLLLNKSKEDVIYEVAKFYYQIQVNQTQKGILEANLSQIQGLLTVTDKQFQNGFAKKLDVDRLRVQQSNLETQINNLNLQILQQKQALLYAMNMPLETDIVLTDTITETTSTEVNPIAVQPAFSQKIDLQVLKKQQELYELDEARWRAGYYPTLGLFANYSALWQANSIGDLTSKNSWARFSQIGVRLNIPIFDGFYKSSQLQTARLNRLQTAQDYQLALLGYQLRHLSAVTAIQVNQNTLRSVQQTRQLSEEVYRVSQSRYREGLAPITELLDAESSMRQAQTNYITTLAQIKLAEVDLLNANGQLLKIIE